MRIITLVAASALALLASPANAAANITFTTGVGALPSTIGSPNFSQTFGSGAVNGTSFIAGAGETVTGTVNLYSSDVSGQAIGPVNKTDNFLSILNGSYEITFSSGMRAVTFLIGGLDSYNSVVLNFVGGGSQILNGREIIGLSNVGAPTNSGESGLVRYDFAPAGPAVSSIVFGSTQAAFEIDDVVAAVPEPATWLMMILGFGLVGAGLRRRRGVSNLATA
jgi:hypothetical protein